MKSKLEEEVKIGKGTITRRKSATLLYMDREQFFRSGGSP